MFPNKVVVDFGVIASNFRKLQAVEPDKTLVPVIKSDGYGHGAVETARALIGAGATHLAVFRLDEAVHLRENGIDAAIWVLLGALPEEAALAVKYDFTLVCFNVEQAKALSRVAEKDITLHLAIDTGMGRLGVPVDEAMDVLREIRSLPHIIIKGICSHIANAGNASHPVTIQQVEGFRKVLGQLPPDMTENHSCASTAWLTGLLPELNYARPGICVYIKTRLPNGSETENAMSLQSQIVSLKTLPAGYSISYGSRYTLKRDSRIAVVPLGYEDGYLRSLSNKTHALLHGRRIPLLGTVCMSMCMFDVTDVADAKIGDEVVLLGKQGSDEITVEELAAIADTTEHELLCAIGKKR